MLLIEGTAGETRGKTKKLTWVLRQVESRTSRSSNDFRDAQSIGLKLIDRSPVIGIRKDGFPTNDPKVIAWKMDRLQKKIDQNRDWLHFSEQIDLDAETVIVSYGSSARTSLEAKYEYEKRTNKKIGFLRLITLWPFHYKKLTELLKNAKRVVVVEMNQGQMIREISRVVGRGVDVTGVNRVDGELITPEEVLAVL